MKRRIRLLPILIVVCIFAASFVPAEAAGESAYSESSKLTKATKAYLNEFYRKQHPERSVEIMYGSPKDIRELRNLKNRIVSRGMSKKKKAKTISKWVANNIKYDASYFFCCYPIDVYHHRIGCCEGYAWLIQELLRLDNIPAVVCSGYCGDMKKIKVSSLENRKGHAWVCAYVGGKWAIYDPLNGVYGKSDDSYYSRWYYTTLIEGITPYYKGMKHRSPFSDSVVHYKDGRPILFGEADTLYGCINNMLTFRSDAYSENDGCSYVESPERRQKMKAGECYAGGWTLYGDMLHHLYRENGIAVEAKFTKLKGNDYYMGRDGSFPVKVSAEFAKSTSLELGSAVLKVGKTVKFRPDWCEKEIADGRVIVYETDNKNVSVKKDGTITALKPGPVVVDCMSKDSVSDPGCYNNNSFHLYIQKKLSDCKLSIKLKKKHKYTGKAVKPKITIRNNGKLLKEHVDYVLSYNNNKRKGTAKVTITGVGDYYGIISRKFKIY